MNDVYFHGIIVRFKSTSIILTGIYLYTFDFFFENLALFRFLKERNIKINELFDYQLNKPKCSIFITIYNNSLYKIDISIRKAYLNRYIDILNAKAPEFNAFNPPKYPSKVIHAGISAFKLRSAFFQDKDYALTQNKLYFLYKTLSNLTMETITGFYNGFQVDLSLLLKEFSAYKGKYQGLPKRK